MPRGPSTARDRVAARGLPGHDRSAGAAGDRQHRLWRDRGDLRGMGNEPAVVVDWMRIADAADAEAFAAALQSQPRQAYGRNAIGAALLEGLRLMDENDIDGWRRVIDFSGDRSATRSGIEDARAQVRRGRHHQRPADPAPRRSGARKVARGAVRTADHRRPGRVRRHRRDARQLRGGGPAQAGDGDLAQGAGRSSLARAAARQAVVDRAPSPSSGIGLTAIRAVPLRSSA